MENPVIFTFDIFGTVLDWRKGLLEALRQKGIKLDPAHFDRIIDHQGASEQKQFKSYSEIVADSLVYELGMNGGDALEVGREAGNWSLFPDSVQGLRELMTIAPCVAMTNSDLVHRLQVEGQLGFKLSHWFCAEELGVYKPNPDFWDRVSTKLNVPFSKKWWHVSAYADYDLTVAKKLGLTCIFVKRDHNRPGFSDSTVKDLKELIPVALASD